VNCAVVPGAIDAVLVITVIDVRVAGGGVPPPPAPLPPDPPLLELPPPQPINTTVKPARSTNPRKLLTVHLLWKELYEGASPGSMARVCLNQPVKRGSVEVVPRFVYRSFRSSITLHSWTYPMRTLLQMLLLCLASVGLYCTRQPDPSRTFRFSAQAAKTIILADWTEPFPNRSLRRP
jgi:hypothetical protein